MFGLITIFCYLTDVDGPDNVVLQPGHTAYNVTEGTTLGPINCTATCYPKCSFEWKTNRTRSFENFLSSETLVVVNIRKNQAGIYRCLVVHSSYRKSLRRTDISVNVHCKYKNWNISSQRFLLNTLIYNLNNLLHLITYIFYRKHQNIILCDSGKIERFLFLPKYNCTICKFDHLFLKYLLKKNTFPTIIFELFRFIEIN